MADLSAGRPLAAPGDGYVNLIHVEDAVRAVLAAAAKEPGEPPPQGPRAFNVADGSPVLREVFLAELARRLGAPPPRFEAPTDAEAESLRTASSKQVRNDRMLRELGVCLEFPSFREGLASITCGFVRSTSRH